MKSTYKNVSIYLFVLSLQGMLYKLTGVINTVPFQIARSLQLPSVIDRMVPFVPEGIWFYSLYYLILLGGVLLSFDEHFHKFLKGFILMSVIADMIFVVIPASMPIMVLTDPTTPSLTNDLLRFILSIDTRGNCFPSLHCAHSFLMTYWFYRSNVIPAFLKHLTLISTVLVVLSTLLIKQHWFVDIVGALILFAFILRIHEKKFQNQRV
jgi:membrane-associated phospholipid phosphatase